MHPSTESLLQYFTSDHLTWPQSQIVDSFAEIAEDMLQLVGEGPESTVGLRKLLEAKDCFVRASIRTKQ